MRTKTVDGRKYIQAPTGKWVLVNSLVRVGKVGDGRWLSFCARSGGIRGSWRTDKESPNWLQRRRWKCGYVEGEVRA